MANGGGGESLRMRSRPLDGGGVGEAELPLVGARFRTATAARSESPLAQGVRRLGRSTTALITTRRIPSSGRAGTTRWERTRWGATC